MSIFIYHFFDFDRVFDFEPNFPKCLSLHAGEIFLKKKQCQTVVYITF